MGLAVSGLSLAGRSQAGVLYEPVTTSEKIQKGQFQPTWESLETYQIPDWYRNAKFGMWAHWGPQCQPGAGDWYARGMYEEGSKQYRSHLAK